MSVAAPAPATAPTPSPDRHPLRKPAFRRFWIGAGLSVFGDQFYFVALPWIVLQLTGSGVAMGTVAMCAGIPRAVLMLMGGAVSDRTSPRRILIATASARAALVATIGVLLWLHALSLTHIYLLALAFGVADAFALPAAGPMLRSLVEPRELPAANSVWQSTALFAGIAGPAPAGMVMKALGASWAFLLDSVSFLCLIVALRGLPDPPASPAAPGMRGVWASIVKGLRYVGGDVALRSLMLLAAVLNFCLSGPLSVGLAYAAKNRFTSPAAFGGWLSSVALGTLAGMLGAGILKSRRRGLLLLAISGALGAATACLGLLHGFWPVAALLVLMGALSGFVNVQFQAWFQGRVDRAVLGRVSSVAMLSGFGLMPLSMAAAGIGVEWSVAGTFAVSGAAVLAVAGFGALQRPVREIR